MTYDHTDCDVPLTRPAKWEVPAMLILSKGPTCNCEICRTMAPRSSVVTH